MAVIIEGGSMAHKPDAAGASKKERLQNASAI